MKNLKNVVIVTGLLVAVVVVLAARREGHKADGPAAVPAVTAALPRLVDLGASKCIPCKAMAPILEELRQECAGKMEVVFIDVWENPDAAKQYGINLIPTQIFYDAAGNELWRHEGFLAKADIVAKWAEFEVKL